MAACMLLASSAAHAATFDGQKLYRYCKTEHQLCYGYILGATDAITWLRDDVCVPEGVNGETLGAVVVNWMDRFPARRTEAGQTVVFNALKDAYRCKQ
jgi:hypothetical protein